MMRNMTTATRTATRRGRGRGEEWGRRERRRAGRGSRDIRKSKREGEWEEGGEGERVEGRAVAIRQVREWKDLNPCLCT